MNIQYTLEHLPLVGEAFRKGEVSYSKVRALTRVATPENEGYLLMIARHGTASHMERLVRACRQVQASEALETVNRRHAARSLGWYYDDDGFLVLEGGFAVKALDDGALVFIRPDGRRVERGPPPWPPPDPDGLARWNRREGLEIGPETCVSLWDGSTMDLAMAVEGVLCGARGEGGYG